MQRTAHLILAGGSGERLGGVRKAGLRIGGESLLERVRRALPQGALTLVSTGRHAVEDFGDLGGAVAVPDAEAGPGGPLAGLLAALAYLAGEGRPETRVLTVAVDTPFLPRDFAARLSAAVESGAPAAVAACAGNLYPTNALWPLAALGDLARRAEDSDGPRGPRDLVRALGAAVVTWPTAPDGDPFANLNTLSDLVSLGRRARRKQGTD